MNKSHIFLLLVLTLVFSCKEAKKDVEEKITDQIKNPTNKVRLSSEIF